MGCCFSDSNTKIQKSSVKYLEEADSEFKSSFLQPHGSIASTMNHDEETGY
jgi:hypothetical protein